MAESQPPESPGGIQTPSKDVFYANGTAQPENGSSQEPQPPAVSVAGESDSNVSPAPMADATDQGDQHDDLAAPVADNTEPQPPTPESKLPHDIQEILKKRYVPDVLQATGVSELKNKDPEHLDFADVEEKSGRARDAFYEAQKVAVVANEASDYDTYRNKDDVKAQVAKLAELRKEYDAYLRLPAEKKRAQATVAKKTVDEINRLQQVIYQEELAVWKEDLIRWINGNKNKGNKDFKEMIESLGFDLATFNGNEQDQVAAFYDKYFTDGNGKKGTNVGEFIKDIANTCRKQPDNVIDLDDLIARLEKAKWLLGSFGHKIDDIDDLPAYVAAHGFAYGVLDRDRDTKQEVANYLIKNFPEKQPFPQLASNPAPASQDDEPSPEGADEAPAVPSTTPEETPDDQTGSGEGEKGEGAEDDKKEDGEHEEGGTKETMIADDDSDLIAVIAYLQGIPSIAALGMASVFDRIAHGRSYQMIEELKRRGIISIANGEATVDQSQIEEFLKE